MMRVLSLLLVFIKLLFFMFMCGAAAARLGSSILVFVVMVVRAALLVLVVMMAREAVIVFLYFQERVSVVVLISWRVFHLMGEVLKMVVLSS